MTHPILKAVILTLLLPPLFVIAVLVLCATLLLLATGILNDWVRSQLLR